jgi:hypothetical protein
MPEVNSGFQPAQSPTGLTYYTPPFAMINEALAARQKEYDNNELAINNIEAFKDKIRSFGAHDKKVHADYVTDLDARIDDIAKNASGDLSQSTNKIKELNRKIAKDFSSNGVAYNLTQYHDAATKYLNDLQERGATDKDRVSPDRINYYIGKVMKDANANGIGDGTNGQYNGFNGPTVAPDTDKDKFLNEFVKNEQASLHQNGYEEQRDQFGNVIYKFPGKEEIKYEDVLKHATAALHAKLQSTGEMDDYWNIYGASRFKSPDEMVNAYDQSKLIPIAQGIQKTQAMGPLMDQIANDVTSGDSDKVINAQRQINQLYDQTGQHHIVAEDGKYGPETESALAKMTQERDAQEQQLTSMAQQHAQMTPEEKLARMKDEWSQNFVSQIAAPYAGAKAHSKDMTKYEIRADEAAKIRAANARHGQTLAQLDKLTQEHVKDVIVTNTNGDSGGYAPLKIGGATVGEAKATLTNIYSDLDQIRSTFNDAVGLNVTNRTPLNTADYPSLTYLHGRNLSQQPLNNMDLANIYKATGGNPQKVAAMFDEDGTDPKWGTVTNALQRMRLFGKYIDNNPIKLILPSSNQKMIDKMFENLDMKFDICREFS